MKNIINNGLLISGTLFLLGAGPAWAAAGMRYDQNDKYADKELTLDLFGSASIGQQTINKLSRDKISHDARLGAGVGLKTSLGFPATGAGMTNGATSFGSAVPPGAPCHLVANGWPAIGKKTTQGYQWTSGYWAVASARETTYLPPPPATVEVGPNVAAPSIDYAWSPGCWTGIRGVMHGARVIGRKAGWIGIGARHITFGLRADTFLSEDSGITLLSTAAFSLHRFILSQLCICVLGAS